VFPTARWAPEWFDRLLSAPGITYRLARRKAVLCACRDERGSGPSPTCPLCGGEGYRYDPLEWAEYEEEVALWTEADRDMALPTGRVSRGLAELMGVWDEYGAPVAGASLEEGRLVVPGAQDGDRYWVRYRAPVQGRGFLQGITRSRTWAERGEVQAGDAVLTVAPKDASGAANPLYALAPHDRVLVLDTRVPYTQLLRRDMHEALTFYPLRVERARAVVGGSEVVYTPGVDFRLEGGRVVWEAGHGPPSRAYYALDYLGVLEYYVLEDLGQVRTPEGMDLPRRYRLRLWNAWPGRGGGVQ